MATTTTKAQEALRFAQEKAAQCQTWIELHNALFGVGGKATELFPTESERTAFSRSEECQQIYAIFDQLPAPKSAALEEWTASANGAISVRLPRTVHAALLAEAKAEGVSLNQLCLSKLLLQLKALA